MLIFVVVTAVAMYLLLPLSAADRRMMATYERLGKNDPKVGVTRAQVIRQLGPPSSQTIPAIPGHAVLYTWVAEFESSLEYHKFTLNLQFGRNDDVIGWGLSRSEYRGLQALLIRILRFGGAKIRL
jgi:hypothetical protein